MQAFVYFIPPTFPIISGYTSKFTMPSPEKKKRKLSANDEKDLNSSGTLTPEELDLIMAPVSRSDFKNMKRVLIKAGTSVVTHTNGTVALSRIAFIVEQITRLIHNGVQVILVSSGSVGIGKQKLGHHLSPSYEADTSFMRSFAATGQSGLMGIYEYMFSYNKVQCAQILLTDDDFLVPERKSNLKQTLDRLMGYNVVPILNENDVISTRKAPYRDSELKIVWDNDSLACLVAKEMSMELTILLTDVDGLYKALPPQGGHDNVKNQIISLYNPLVHSELTIGPKSRVGRGGMTAKIKSAMDAVNESPNVKAVVVASGRMKDSIDRIVAGENIGTLFVAESSLSAIQLNPTEIAINARTESRKLQQCSSGERKQILLSIAAELRENKEAILMANKRDLEEAERTRLNVQLLNRLKLTEKKLKVVIDGIVQIANDEEPIGRVVREMELSQTLNLKQWTTPIGVLLVIFESRPDVLPQVIALSIKSGNGLLLKGGSEAFHSNQCLHQIIAAAITKYSRNKVIGDRIVHLVETRKDIKSLLSLDRSHIDLIIPRGSMQFVQFIENNTSIPVLGHSSGLCHLFIDRDADLTKTLRILVDSKCNYPSACNAAETVLVDRQFAHRHLKDIVNALKQNEVKICVGPKAKSNSLLSAFPATKSFEEEYGDLEVTLEIVDGIKSAIDHINHYGSGHTDCIVTENEEHRRLFLNTVDSACVFHNASTRFADGYRFGLGAEVGISTNRIHARGPVGIEGLLTTKWVLHSKESDVVQEYQEGQKQYTHKLLTPKL